ncbi:TVP38/TMEM64 family protein [Kurthia huakuii]|uniref:TVP38/TMEM64 family protein n=1 Tax=Kurthia huakuii TaxID=1421019 RepID=UPI0004972F7A|nr:TVP38/TMEM64 family protein [Kurthia huakuii]MBM7700773.1 putative membrane protein YdjX (TVP38/TMEM64 family) [Kurthia huakuii]
MPAWLTVENFQAIAQQHQLIGMILAFVFPFLEAFLPVLPLAAFVVANASAYGLWIGFLLSWTGSVAGAYCVFLLVRKFGRAKIFRFITERKAITKLITWVEYHGFTPLFVLLCFPFTPTSVVNVVAGLSKLKKKHYFITIMLAKVVQLLVISWIGSDLRALITQPERTVIVVLLIVLMWGGGKYAEKRMNKKMAEDLNKQHRKPSDK